MQFFREFPPKVLYNIENFEKGGKMGNAKEGVIELLKNGAQSWNTLTGDKKENILEVPFVINQLIRDGFVEKGPSKHVLLTKAGNWEFGIYDSFWQELGDDWCELVDLYGETQIVAYEKGGMIYCRTKGGNEYEEDNSLSMNNLREWAIACWKDEGRK